MISSQELISQAVQLPVEARADIVHQLLLSLEPEEFGDDEIAAAWQQEIETRLKKIESGNFQAHEWRQAIQEIRQELKKETTT